MSLPEAQSLLLQLSSSSNPLQLLDRLKLCILQLPIFPTINTNDPLTPQYLTVARDAFEFGAISSLQADDIDAFERYVQQLKVFYHDYRGLIPESAKKWEITGLYLLSLLTANRIGDFHTEIELLPAEFHENEFVKYAVRLEQELMEGSYNQLWNASARIPSALYRKFVDTLVETVRERILDCCAKSYDKLSLNDASQLLNLPKVEDAANFATSRGWEIQGTILFFKKQVVDHLEIPAHKVIGQVLSYASELERII